MYSHTGRPLVTSRQIVANPGDVPWESGIDAHNRDEDTSVNDSRDTSASGGEHNNEADGDQSHEEEDKGRPLAMAVRVVSTDDGEGGGGDVDGDRQQLRSGCRVTKISDNRWQEEANSIERGHNPPVHCFK